MGVKAAQVQASAHGELARVDRRIGMAFARAGRSWRRRRAAATRQRSALSVAVPGWAAELVDPAFTAAWNQAVTGSDRSDLLDRAFIQPALANPIVRSVPVGAPERFRRLAVDACFTPAERGFDLESWSEAQRRYRVAHARSTLDVFGPGDAAQPSVAVVCVTHRPDLIGNVVRSYRAQTWPAKHLVLVLNGDAYESVAPEVVRAAAPEATVLRIPDRSLGECLNTAIDALDDRFVAKFDDDDFYGPEFLADIMLAARYCGAGVIGKHSCFAFLEGSNRTIVRFPGVAYEYTPFLAGGTLVIDRNVTRNVRFPDLTLGEDQGFIRRCLRRGISTFAIDPFNYVQVRSSGTTWRIADEAYARESIEVGHGCRLEAAVV